MAIEIRAHAVEVYTLGAMLRGTCQTARRVSDMMNESDSQMVLTDVEIWRYGDPPGTVESHTRGMVTKTAIELMAELDQGGPQPQANPDAKFGLHVPKVPQHVFVHTTNFSIKGDFNLSQAVNLDTTLSLFRDNFLPLTRAMITPDVHTRRFKPFHRNFILINRAQVSYLGSAALPPPISF